MEFFLSPEERERLGVLLMASARVLLLLFTLAVVLPLLQASPFSPAWLLDFTGAMSSSGFLALLAMLLVHLAAAIHPESEPIQVQRQRLADLCRWLPLAFVLLIPLQVFAAWNSFEAARSASQLSLQRTRQELQRISTFRRAVTGASTLDALQSNLVAIQAPPLSPRDKSKGLPALRKNLLDQLDSAERQARRPTSTTTATPALLQSSLRVVLLSLALGHAFSAASATDS